jgi:hypothetical protein
MISVSERTIEDQEDINKEDGRQEKLEEIRFPLEFPGSSKPGSCFNFRQGIGALTVQYSLTKVKKNFHIG